MSRVHGTFSGEKLEIRGYFHASGPLTIGSVGGCPVWVAKAFEENPEIETIAVNYKNRGVIYSSMKDKE